LWAGRIPLWNGRDTMHRARTVAALALLLGLSAALAGCRKAQPYTPRAARPSEPGKADRRKKEKERPEPLKSSVGWIDPGRRENKQDVRIEFVHEGSQKEEWNKLKKFWTDPLPGRAAAAVGLPGLAGLAALGQPGTSVKIKVP